MSDLNLPEGFTYVVSADGTVLQRYDYEATFNGLSCYSWPEGTKVISRPTNEQTLRRLRRFYPPTGGVEYV